MSKPGTYATCLADRRGPAHPGAWTRLAWMAVASLLAGVASAANYFVNDADTLGDVYCQVPGVASNDGLSPTTPKNSLSDLLGLYTFSSNDTVFVDSGTYLLSQTVIVANMHGTSNAWVNLRGVAGRTILDGANLGYGSCLEINSDWMLVEGLTCRNAEFGIRVYGTSAHHVRLERNVCSGNRQAGIEIMTYPMGGDSDFQLIHNLVYGSPTGMVLGGIGTPDGKFFVLNNTVAVTGGKGLVCNGVDGGTSLKHNIVTASNGGACLGIRGAALGASDYNCWRTTSDASTAWRTDAGVTRTYANLAQWRSTGQDTHSLDHDPRFADLSTGDYHVRSTGGRWKPTATGGANAGYWVTDTQHSPCIDAGDPNVPVGAEPADHGGRVNLGADGGTTEASRTTPARALNLLAPRGGEVAEGGILVRWAALGRGWAVGDTVRLEYRTPGTTQWRPVVNGATRPYLDGQFFWTNTTWSDQSYELRIVVDVGATSTVLDSTLAPFSMPGGTPYFYVNDNSTNSDVYCTARGLATNDGRGPDKPVNDLGLLLSREDLPPGAIVHVDTGTYNLGSNVTLAADDGGTVEAPVTLRGSVRGSVLNRSGGGTGSRALVVQADHVRIERLICTGAEVGIAVDAGRARNVELVANTCFGNSAFGLAVTATGSGSGEEYLLLQNLLHDNGAGMLLQGSADVANGRAVFVVENNTVCGGGHALRCLNANGSGRRTLLLKNNILRAQGAGNACVVVPPAGLTYSDYNNLHALDGAAVGILAASPTNSLTLATLAAWRTATQQDPGSLSADSLFVAPASGNYALQPASPGVDAGIDSFWMYDATDLAGRPRIAGRSVDIGAHELALAVELRILLEGPYQTTLNAMRTSLAANGQIPLASPYAAAPRSVTRIPTGVVDWVLLEFRTATNASPAASRSAFLSAGGLVVDDDGVSLPAVNLSAATNYYVVVKHRNHLAAMSAARVAFTGDRLVYDFTGSGSAFFGGGVAAVPVGSVRWAAAAGDVDGDGAVRPVDATMAASRPYAAGYRRADLDGTGMVDTPDMGLCQARQGRASPVPRPEVTLDPALLIRPGRATLDPGATLGLHGMTVSAQTATSGTTGGLTGPTLWLSWATLNAGGGSWVNANSATTAIYNASTTAATLDTVQAWDGDDRLGRATINVISDTEAELAGKVVILAGRKSETDPLWPATDYLADLAYTTLRYRGFTKDNLQYLSPEPVEDVDGNGLYDDIDNVNSFANTAHSFTNWCANSDRLFVYLVDHGGDSAGDGFFRLSATETLTAAQLDAWLDALQDAAPTTVVTVLLDFCYAGSFLDELEYTDPARRIVVAACGSGQPSYFVAGGLVSFSDAFFSGILLGYDVMTCFEMAADAMDTYQTAELDDNGDGAYSTTNDGALATGYYIGPTYVAGGDRPQIGEVCGNQVLTEETAATLWIGSVQSVNPITRAWCFIVPPGHDPDPADPVTALPELALAYDAASGRYTVTYDGFTAAGTYKAIFYVQDAQGGVSPPLQSYVAQIGYDDRLVLVAGGDSQGAAWSPIEYLASLAWNTARLRLFDRAHTRFLCAQPTLLLDGDSTNDVDATAGLAALEETLTEWARTNSTDRLTLYFMGEGTNDTLRLSPTETLSAGQLADWLDAFQATNPVHVTVVLDFDGCGAFVSALSNRVAVAALGEATRVVIASAAAGQRALMDGGGTVSFSQYFLSGVMAGQTCGDAYTAARRAIRRVSGGVRQRAQLDDTGNGAANEKNVDGLLAATLYFGSAFMTGADTPVIGAVQPPVALDAGVTNLTLWAADVGAMRGISNVWCVITPPDYDGTGPLPQLDLPWNGVAGRYEAIHAGFTLPGAYALTYYAIDLAGELAEPVQSEVIHPDAYEPDNSAAEASFYYGPAQTHTLHAGGDVDWVRFYAVSNYVYEIETYHLSTNLDTVVELFQVTAGGELVSIDYVDDEGRSLGEYTGMDHPAEGFYYLKVSAYDDGQPFQPGAYELDILIPAAGTKASLIVVGVNRATAGALPAGAYAEVTRTAYSSTKYFSGSTSVTWDSLVPGTYTITVPAPANFFPREDPDTPNQVTSLTNPNYANPRQVSLVSGWYCANFEHIPYLTVSGGVVRDAWTRDFLSGAAISFRSTTGSFAGYVADGHILFTNYSADWYSQAGGAFPGDVILAEVTWDLLISKSGYVDYQAVNAVSNVSRGASVNLGTHYLVPVDADSDAIADSWETTYFGGGIDPGDDSDLDGQDHRAEYICGTVPTNRASVLALDVFDATGSDGFQIEWPVVLGRIYSVKACAEMLTGGWDTVAGPWEATNGLTRMEWTDTGVSSRPVRFYRIGVAAP